MSLGFSKGLVQKLQETNSNNNIVFNSQFVDWEDHLRLRLKDRNYSGKGRYEKGPDRELLEFCKNHARKHQQKRRNINTVMLTHPFYLHLSHMDEVETDIMQQEVGNYTYNLIKLLNRIQIKPKASVAVLETIHHYAAVTSLLLENGLINQVIFTLHDSGYPLEARELEQFRGNVFFGGGYNGRCLRASIDKMKKMFTKSIWGIQELVLNSPEDCQDTLKVSGVNGLDTNQMITLQQLERRLRL